MRFDGLNLSLFEQHRHRVWKMSIRAPQTDGVFEVPGAVTANSIVTTVQMRHDAVCLNTGNQPRMNIFPIYWHPRFTIWFC